MLFILKIVEHCKNINFKILSDHGELINKIKNLKNVTLDQAMNSKVWNGIKDSWTDDIRIPKCESTCAEKIRDKFIKEQL